MEEEVHELPDHHQYQWVMFDIQTLKFFVSSLEFYIELLKDERKQLENDPYFSSFLSDETRREFSIDRGLLRPERIKEWLEDAINRNEDHYDAALSPDHGTVRYLKSVSLLYLGKLKIRRNEFASRPNVSSNSLAAIDREITKWDERLAKSGVFAKASPLPLLVEQQFSPFRDEQLPELESQSLVSVSRPAPVVVDRIEILDTELRNRCLDLFDQFQKNGQPDRNDTVVAEATRILEDRLRKVLGCSTGMTGRDLAAAAFSGDQPKLQISIVKSEQQAVLQLFLGTFGLIRNQVQHRLIESMPAERVVQILGWIDYLLTIINQSQQQADEDAVRSEDDSV